MHVFNNILTKILKENIHLQQYVVGEASDLESDDVLHTMIALAYVKLNMHDTFERINVPLLVESLSKSTIKR